MQKGLAEDESESLSLRGFSMTNQSLLSRIGEKFIDRILL